VVPVDVRPLDNERDPAACDAVIASLPDWFGVDEGIRQCAAAVRTHQGFVSEEDGVVVGFLTWAKPRAASAEITWMAVAPGRRRAGHGRALIDALVARLHDDGVRLLLVKTLSDRDPHAGYAETRAFYEAVGFTAATDLDLWGPENPALLYVRTVSAPPTHEPGVPSPTVDDLVSAARSRYRRVTPREAHQEVAAGDAVLIDIRPLELRRAGGDVPGAHVVPLTSLQWVTDPASPWHIDEIRDHDTRVIVMCQEGYSSTLAAASLLDLGLHRATDVAGGAGAWADDGLPVDRSG